MRQFDQAIWLQLMSFIDHQDESAIAALGRSELEMRVLDWTDPADELSRTPLMWAYWTNRPIAAAALARAGANFQACDALARSVTWYAKNIGLGVAQENAAAGIRATVARLSMEEAILRELDLPDLQRKRPALRRPRI